jgi:hypothetical protein
MTLYVLLGEVDYEGFTLLGVYDTREQAEDAYDLFVEARPDYFDRPVIQAREVGVPAEVQW